LTFVGEVAICNFDCRVAIHSGNLVLIDENASYEAVAREDAVFTVVYGPVERLAQALRIANPVVASRRSGLTHTRQCVEAV